MILNTTFHYLHDNHVSDFSESSIIPLLELPDNISYYYIEFKRALHHLSAVITDEMLSRLINDPNTSLVLCNSHESFHSVVDEIYQNAVVNLGIPEHKILLVSESADIRCEVQAVAEKIGKKEIQVKWLRIFEHACHSYLVHMMMLDKINSPEWIAAGSPMLPTTLDEKPYIKKFVNFNRRWRLHRPTFVALMKTRNILDKGYVSLAPCDDQNDWSRIWPWIMSHHHNTDVARILECNKDESYAIPPMYLDTDELMTNRANVENSTDYLYEATYFSVVSETNFYDFTPGRFISEKIFKPITFGHPFVVLSRPHTMKLMQELGYKTFSPWIDESYDDETDDSKRLLMVLDETERLSNLSPGALADFLNGVRGICNYNQNVLLNKSGFVTDI